MVVEFINYQDSMSLSIITFADLGERKNLKTPGILPVIDKFRKEGLLQQVICRRTKNHTTTNIHESIPIIIFKAIRIFVSH